VAKSRQERELDEALKELYPFDKVMSEYAFKVGQTTLYVDRFLPQRMLAIEVDGRQHSEFVRFFHGNAEGYLSAQSRDRRKEEWLADNGFALVRFRYDETITVPLLRERVIKALNQ
jgi:very-short-patch-repair endonuclease